MSPLWLQMSCLRCQSTRQSLKLKTSHLALCHGNTGRSWSVRGWVLTGAEMQQRGVLCRGAGSCPKWISWGGLVGWNLLEALLSSRDFLCEGGRKRGFSPQSYLRLLIATCGVCTPLSFRGINDLAGESFGLRGKGDGDGSCVSWEAALATLCVSYCNKSTQCLRKIFSPNCFDGIGLEVPDASGRVKSSL